MRSGLDTTVTSHWNSRVNISSATFSDDAVAYGSISAPARVTVDGINFPIAGSDLVVTIQRNNAWVFLSEIEFNVAPIPEPEPEPETETFAMLLTGLKLLSFAVRRRKQSM